MKKILVFVNIIVAAVSVPLAVTATPHCQTCPYTCADLALGKKECSELSNSRGICCVDLTQKGLELAKERERLLKEQAGAQVAVACPPGFKPSERSCSQEERRRGCHDQRVGPNRMGCVTATFR